MGILTLQFSFKCNNFCISCLNEEVNFELPLSKIKRYIIAAKEKKLSTIVITGGEPTINKKLIRIIEISKENNFPHIAIQTNARKLAQKDYLRNLISAGVDMFFVTIYGYYPQLHDFITQIDGSFIQTVEGIKNIVEEEYFIRTNTIITQSNMEYLPEIAKFIITLSVNEAKFTFPRPTGRAKRYFSLVIPKLTHIKPFLHEALITLKNSSIKPLVEAVPPCFLIGFERYYADYIGEKIDGFVPIIKENNLLHRGEIFEKGYSKKCVICDYRSVCSGVYIEYLLHFGDSEIKPVKIGG